MTYSAEPGTVGNRSKPKAETAGRPVDRGNFKPRVEAFMQLEISQRSSILVECRQCWDTGLAPQTENRGRCGSCAGPGRARNPAAALLARAIHRRLAANQLVEERPFQLACLLTHFSTTRPIPRAPLQELMEVQEREFKKQIEILRRDWLLPIGSRKGRPNGYWIITTEEDFMQWHRHFRQQALTEFSTANQLMEQNFPALAMRNAALGAELQFRGGAGR
jgi:hypothetical protein